MSTPKETFYQKMVECMANEISSLKEELAGANEKLRLNDWALQIARDEAAVNASLLAKRRSLRVVNSDVPVYFLPDISPDDAQAQPVQKNGSAK